MSGERARDDSITLRVRVRGRVQGVGYRAFAAQEAAARGLSGWVRNEPDGSVSALVSGPEPLVTSLCAALRGGPPHARVTALETEPAAPGTSVPADFRIAR